MSTWHQRNAAHARFMVGENVYLGHPTMWTILEDPPNELRTSICFESKALARSMLEVYRKKGKEHLLLLPPLIKHV